MIHLVDERMRWRALGLASIYARLVAGLVAGAVVLGVSTGAHELSPNLYGWVLADTCLSGALLVLCCGPCRASSGKERHAEVDLDAHLLPAPLPQLPPQTFALFAQGVALGCWGVALLLHRPAPIFASSFAPLWGYFCVMLAVCAAQLLVSVVAFVVSLPKLSPVALPGPSSAI